MDQDNYNKNKSIDIGAYNQKTYNSTLWQKVYKDDLKAQTNKNGTIEFYYFNCLATGLD